jgi:hypothetical protein
MKIKRLPEYLHPLVSSLLFVVLFISFYAALKLGRHIDTMTFTPRDAGTLKFRLLWGASALALLMTLIGHLAISVGIIVSNLSGSNKLKLVLMGGCLAGLVAMGTVSYHLGFDMGGGIAILLSETARPALPKGARILLDIINTLVIVSFVLTVASCACMATTQNSLEGQIRRIKKFKLSLYLSAAVLALGVLEVYALANLAVARHTGSRESFLVLANSLPLSAGIVFSIFLAAVYLPVALVQGRWLESHFKKLRQEKEDIADWMTLNGLEGSPLTILGSYIAVFVPLLTGLLTNLLA